MLNATKKDASIFPYKDIVILGNFNPHIIQTAFFRQYKVFPEQEIASAEEVAQTKQQDDNLTVEVKRFYISPIQTILVFKTFELYVYPVRLQARLKTEADSSMVLSGLKKLFTLLPHTPVTAIGFNFQAHWKTSSGIKHQRSLFLGKSDKLVSVFGKDFSLGGRIRFEDIGAKILFETEPSISFKDAIFCSFNFHYDIPRNSAERLLSFLPNFNKARERATTIALSLFEKPIEIFEPGMEAK